QLPSALLTSGSRPMAPTTHTSIQLIPMARYQRGLVIDAGRATSTNSATSADQLNKTIVCTRLRSAMEARTITLLGSRVEMGSRARGRAAQSQLVPDTRRDRDAPSRSLQVDATQSQLACCLALGVEPEHPEVSDVE